MTYYDSVINAREELCAKLETYEIRKKTKLTVLKIDIKFRGDSYETIESLDFDYDNGFGEQELFGTVYCKDANGNPVWFTRGEYDGSEWWKANTVPAFYAQ